MTATFQKKNHFLISAFPTTGQCLDERQDNQSQLFPSALSLAMYCWLGFLRNNPMINRKNPQVNHFHNNQKASKWQFIFGVKEFQRHQKYYLNHLNTQIGAMIVDCTKIHHIYLCTFYIFQECTNYFPLCIYLTVALDFKTSPWIFIKVLLRVEQQRNTKSFL